MAFPGTFDIKYYKGDTYQFRIYPKDTAGNAFDLSDYRYDHDGDPLTLKFDTATFAFSESRGSGLGYHKCLAQISDNAQYVTCTIRPEDASYLDPTKVYVYDVQVTKPGTNYDTVLTLLTGTITITDEVSTAGQSYDNNNARYKVIYVDSYNTNGVIPTDNNLYIPGQSATILAGTISRPGFSLSGWNTKSDGTGTQYSVGQVVSMPANDLVLYSRWSPV